MEEIEMPSPPTAPDSWDPNVETQEYIHAFIKAAFSQTMEDDIKVCLTNSQLFLTDIAAEFSSSSAYAGRMFANAISHMFYYGANMIPPTCG
jgi:hypothetical protein